MPFRPRLRLLAAVAAIPFALALTAAPAASAEPDEYVALGDSYSAGNGTLQADLSFFCYRSSLAYPALVANSRPNTRLTFNACQGATTRDVIGGQTRSLSQSTDYVTMSIGGNDIGFAGVIFSCFNTWDEAGCLNTVDATQRRISNELPAKLDATYRDIRSRAPRARVIIVGYPAPFGRNISCSQAEGISAAEAPRLNAMASQLNATIRDRASRAGFTFINPTRAFTGYDICARTPFVWGKKTGLVDMYHPTRAGHRYGYAPLVYSAMR